MQRVNAEGSIATQITDEIIRIFYDALSSTSRVYVTASMCFGRPTASYSINLSPGRYLCIANPHVPSRMSFSFVHF